MAIERGGIGDQSTRASGLRGEFLVPYEPRIFIFDSTEKVDITATHIFKRQVQRKPDSVLTLPTGSSPIPMLHGIVHEFQQGEIDLSRVRIFNIDENWPLPRGHEGTYAYFMDHHLFKHVNIPENQRHIPRSWAEDPHHEAMEYERTLALYGPPDLTFAGLGPDTTCHIGFNEKGSDLHSRTRLVTLHPETIAANRNHFPNPEEATTQAVTQGVETLLETGQFVFIIKGPSKAWGVNRILTGPINSDAPGSFARYHPNVVVLLDTAAAELPQGVQESRFVRQDITSFIEQLDQAA